MSDLNREKNALFGELIVESVGWLVIWLPIETKSGRKMQHIALVETTCVLTHW